MGLTFRSLADLIEHQINEQNQEDRVVIEIHRPGGLGGTPCVDVDRIRAGFDWDSGKLIIVPEKPLVPADVDLQKELNRVKNEVMKLKYENRKLKSKLNEAHDS